MREAAEWLCDHVSTTSLAYKRPKAGGSSDLSRSLPPALIFAALRCMPCREVRRLSSNRIGAIGRPATECQIARV